MIQENKLIVLILIGGVLLLLLPNIRSLRRVRAANFLVYAFYCFFVAKFLSVLEDVWFHDFLNLVSHGFYAMEGLLFLIWLSIILQKGILRNE